MIDPFASAHSAATLPPAELAFGRHLGPWCVVSEHDAVHGWSPARVQPLDACSLSVAAASVQYGLGVFEGLKAQRGPDGALHLFRPHAHALRFANSARRLCLPPLPPDRFVELCAQVAAIHEPLVPRHGEGSLYLRPTLATTDAFLGLRAGQRHLLAVVANPCGPPPTRPLKVWIERDTIRAAPGGLGAVKTGANYAAGLLALEAARARGYDQVLFVDAFARERLSEAGSNNIFVVLDDRVITPALDDTLLAGVTRDSCLLLLRELGLAVEERAPTLRELAAWHERKSLRELFCTGTASSVIAIERLVGDGLELVPPGGSLVAELRRRLDDAQSGRAPCPSDWRVPVPPLRRPLSPRTPPRSRAEARAFADAWAQAWSRRDVEAVLAWFADDVVFTSPRALEVTGAAQVHGKAALRDYWQRAVARRRAIEFTVDDVTLDDAARRLVIHYQARIDDHAFAAAELLTFDDAGAIASGAAYHGAPL
jgi:branched-chain amino acid aminotransferase